MAILTKTVLIVSYTNKKIAYFKEVLHACSLDRIVTVSSCSEARCLLLEQNFDLVVIQSPLRDETGESLSCHIGAKGISQVILVVGSEHYEQVCHMVEDYGVITIASPINNTLFWSAIKMARAAHSKLSMMQNENTKLAQKIEDIRMVDRAKCILIGHANMSEGEAHKYIERQAMNKRMTKREIAEGIIKTYDNE